MEVGGEDIDVVIAGGGICGLATALALHRKGVRSVVLERSETLRDTGAGIGVQTNGWRALDQLGVASHLRRTALPISGIREERFHKSHQEEEQIIPFKNGEVRCLRRSDLMAALAKALPDGTIRFGCQVVSIRLDPFTSQPLTQLQNGNIIKSKVLIGCDGAHSIVADFLGLKPPRLFHVWAVRGFTICPNGHGVPNQLVRTRGHDFLLGRIPIDDKILHWFLVKQGFHPSDLSNSKDPKLIHQFTLESIKDTGLPAMMVEMISNCDLESLTITHIRYRPPWEIFTGRFRRGTVTVAGDAMHVMGPFIGQGGSAALEDAVVLGRKLAKRLHDIDLATCGSQVMVTKIGEAVDEYVKERRMRLLQLSTQTYLLGSILQSSSTLVRFIIVLVMAILFRDPRHHNKYDCGRL